MRIKSTFAIAILALTVTSAVAKPKGSPPDGTISNGVYENPYFGLSYPLPTEFQEVGKPGTGRVGLANLLLIADRHTGSSLRERLLISADNTTAYASLDTKHYVNKFAHATSRQPGVKLLQDVQEIDFAGHHFYGSEWMQDYSGTVLYKSFLSTNVDGYFLSWTFAAESLSRLHELVDSLRQIKFNEH